jgi:immune inhibitor A
MYYKSRKNNMRNESSCTSCLSRSRNVTFIFLVFVAIFQFADPSSTLAVPAAPIVHEVVQPDGSRFQAKKWGDEWSHGWETVEGYTIMQDAATQAWTYAASDADGKMMPTSHVVGIDAVPVNTPQYIRPATQTSNSSKALQISSELKTSEAAVAPTGTANIPVILVNFSDRSTTYAANDFSSLLFGIGNHSMKDYYEEVSYKKFSVSAGPAGVRGWYKASKTHDYYGAAAGSNKDSHPAELVREAVAAADANIDFSKYDSDGDCYVDVVAIVHQGTGEEASKTATDIWSHRWDLYSAGVGEYTTNDNAACGAIKVKDYIIQPEIYQGGLTTMGVFAHEYGHSLGLPDLYDTDNSSNGIGNWCLMAGGSWNQVSRGGDRPAHLSAWCKYKLGWVQPTVISGLITNEEINAASSQADCLPNINWLACTYW